MSEHDAGKQIQADTFLARIKWNTYLPYVFSILLLVSVLDSSVTLTLKYHLSLLDLVFLNTCIVAELIAALALLLRNKLLAGTAIPLLLWLGGGGFFNFSAGLLTAMHLSHLLMVIVGLYLAYFVWFVARGEKKSFIAGTGLGIVVAVALLLGMIWYYPAHPDTYQALLDVGWKGYEFR